MMIKSELVAIRGGTEVDKNFVYATFLRGLYYGETHFSEIPKQIFMENYHNKIATILENPATIFIIACLKEDPEVILGYSLISSDLETVYFVFIKKAWRNIGIGKSLVPSSVKAATHLTRVGLSLAKKRNIIYNPFL